MSLQDDLLKDAPLIFMGTPDFAVASLQGLVEGGYQVKAVYTQPPRSKGRGHGIQKSPVHRAAEAYGLPVETPSSLRSEQVVEGIRAWTPHLIIVAAYGLIIPQEILDIPVLGCLNVHASLLPRWRGAAPIQYAILKGDQVTGVTLMKMDAGLDTGGMIVKREYVIKPETTGGSLTQDLADLGANLLIDHLPIYAREGGALPQAEKDATYAPKILKKEGLLDFSKTAEELARHVRAFHPWPGSWFFYEGKRIKVIEATWEEGSGASFPPGYIVDHQLGIQCAQGVLRPLMLHPENGKIMSVSSFLCGASIPEGAFLEAAHLITV